MATTDLLPYGAPGADDVAAVAKTPADYPSVGLRVHQFDIWRPNYAGATVNINRAGTTELIPCYSNPALTNRISNPQILISDTDALGNAYGKFATPVYVPFSYELDINNTEQTAAELLPLTTLAGENASNARVTSAVGSQPRNLKDIVADTVHFLDFGTVTNSPTTNTATLDAAISAVSTQGGGTVYLPEGTIRINSFTLPSDVILAGEGRDVTVLQSEVADRVIEISGKQAGLRDLTLDGVQLNTGSIGIYGKSKDEITLFNVMVRRFDTGIMWQGGENHVYRRLSLDNNNIGARFLGDSDFTGGSDGSQFTGLDWFQGAVTNHTGVGIEMTVRDKRVRHNVIRQVDFDTNISNDGAVLLSGARWTVLEHCTWNENVVDIRFEDNSDQTLSYRQLVGVQIHGGLFSSATTGNGTIAFDGLCQNIIFDQVQFDGTTFEMNVPVNQVILRDCTEENTSITGESTKIGRWRTTYHNTIQGTTSGTTAAVVWKQKLDPNEVVMATLSAVAEQLNDVDYGQVIVAHGARQAPATLGYDGQTVNFTVGNTVVGQTSGATAIIVADSDSGTTGTLSLGEITGEFVDDEIITESNGSGSARANGVIAIGTTSLVGSETDLHSAGSNSGGLPTGWGAGFQVSGDELQATVAGAASDDIAWTCQVNVVGK